MRIDQLEHRKLLAVNFTGNVRTDFPATQQPGVVILSNVNPGPEFSFPPDQAKAVALQGIVKVSGFDIRALRVTYTSNDDTLSLGFEQPPSQNHPGDVIAGDADNNGNSATVNPDVTAIFNDFKDFPDLTGTEHMAAFLDLRGTGQADIVAGFDDAIPGQPKNFQVAQAINTNPTEPDFGTRLPQFEGNVYLVNSVDHPNLEFSIKNFSQLYQQVTGNPLAANSSFSIGAYAGSGDDIAIGEQLMPPVRLTLSDATIPTPTPTPPEICSPYIRINPHEHRIIDTSHRDLVRVYVHGTSGFKVSQIDPNTVSLNGAKPIAQVIRRVNGDEFPDTTFVFRADQINLPFGKTKATITGSTTDGATFESSSTVLNLRNAPQRRGELARLGGSKAIPGAKAVLARSVSAPNSAQPVVVNYNPAVQASNAGAARQRRPAVSLQRRGVSAGGGVSSRLHHSLNAFATQQASAS